MHIAHETAIYHNPKSSRVNSQLGYNTISVKRMCPQKNCLSLCLRKNITCLTIVQKRIGQVFSFSCKSCVSVG